MQHQIKPLKLVAFLLPNLFTDEIERKEKKPTGDQPGHTGHGRKKPTPNLPPVYITLDECLDCGMPVHEIIALSSAAGFKNKRYIKNYPDIFHETLSSQLKSIFGTASFPFYNLNTKFEIKDMLIFANTSLSSNMRSPSLPTIIDNDDFKQSLYNILLTTHKAVKKQIGDMRKAGDKPALAVPPSNDSAIKEKEINVTCPYCKTLLDEAPKRKKKCPHCNNNIYVKPKQNLFSSIYLTEEQVIELNEYESIEHFNDKRKEEKSRLLNYKRSSVFENVKISSHGGCEACQELHGKIFTIDHSHRNTAHLTRIYHYPYLNLPPCPVRTAMK